MTEEVCPCCKGKGVVEIKQYIGNPYEDHPHRTLPLDYYCTECKQFVTKSHAVNQCHKKFMYKREGAINEM